MTLSELTQLSVAAIAAGLVVYARLVEPYRIRVNRVDIAFANLPESLDGFRICHLSDLHTAGYGMAERTVAGIVSGLEMDLCVLTGDLISKPHGVESLAKVLAGVNSKHGVFAVLGNGEYCHRMPGAAVTDDLKRLGIETLVNQHVSLRLDNTRVDLVGVDDPYLARNDIERAASDLEEGGFRILLAHSPDILMELGGHRFDLILAGHTHGGQILLPLIGPMWTHLRYRLGIVSGYFGPDDLSRLAGRNLSGTHMYVSRGVGGSGIRARFLCPPEVTLLSLRAEKRT